MAFNIKSHGFAVLPVLIIIASIAYVALLVFEKPAEHRNSNTNQPISTNDANREVACTMDAALCPDGSYVGRVGPSCEFAACPDITNLHINSNATNGNVSGVDQAVVWTTYANSAAGLSFEYPTAWELIDLSAEELQQGTIVKFQNPTRLAGLRAQQNGTIAPYYQEYDLVVSRWDDMNSEAARGGSWTGMRTYESLVDFLSDDNAPKARTTTSETVLGGQTAYEVIIGGYGANYGIMAERHGIYQFSFPGIADASGVDDAIRHLITSLIFTN